MANLTLEQIEEIAGRKTHSMKWITIGTAERDALCEMARMCSLYESHPMLVELQRLRAVRDAAHTYRRVMVANIDFAPDTKQGKAGRKLDAALEAAKDVK